ncbi:MAG: hypothetical protein Ct9H300mP22_7130 [Gammaproteobacteria bacterium]|nr:MAG: hypothetical protein Ct9H300mP22_7130 [Gammaproteobacteria bacterium]
MSQVDPRQGRYSKLISAAIIYATYFLLLQLTRDMVAEGELKLQSECGGYTLCFFLWAYCYSDILT